MSSRPYRGWAALTDVGRVRSHNEDSVLAQPPLFVVADGLGGHEAGEVASSIAVQTLLDHAPRRPDAKALARAVRAANREVIRAAREGMGRSGMGTTITAAMVDDGNITIAHVGDSRAYLFSDGRLEQITEDHSMVADMVRRGQITEEESRVHPNRSVITRALGTDPNMVADTYEVEAKPGDILLLCSDGLSGMVDDDTIADILARVADPERAAQALIDAANAAGGHDNISVVLVTVEGTPGSPAAAASRSWLPVIGWVLLAIALVGAIAYGTWRAAQSRYYVADNGGTVAVFRGVPGSFAGLELSWLESESTVPVSALPPAQAARVRATIPVDSLSDGLALIERYREAAQLGIMPDESTPVDAPPGTGSQ